MYLALFEQVTFYWNECQLGIRIALISSSKSLIDSNQPAGEYRCRWRAERGNSTPRRKCENDIQGCQSALCEINPDGQASRGEKIFIPRHSFVRDCLPIASAQWSVRWYPVATWRLVMSSVCA